MPHPSNQVELVCEQCHKTFSVRASLAANRRFCSWECKLAHDASRKITVKCANCGRAIETYRSRPQKYCSQSCAMSARNRTNANPSKHRDISGKKNPMYGHGLTGERNGMYGKTGSQNPAWSGGRKLRADGYVLVYCPDHPHAISDGDNTIYVLEHRLVMEKHIGRYLDPQEVVHHIDGNPRNNAIENLQLFASQSEHISIGHSSEAG